MTQTAQMLTGIDVLSVECGYIQPVLLNVMINRFVKYAILSMYNLCVILCLIETLTGSSVCFIV